MATYKRLPVSFQRGAGAWLWDAEGTRYLDALSGIAVCGLGHAHPAVSTALCEQAGRLIHTSNLYHIELQEKLGDELVRLAHMDRVFFANSGAEANEAAIKIARLHGHRQGIDVPQIVVTEGSFHGRTLATLSATGNRRVQAGFEPLVTGFVRLPYGAIEALEVIAENNEDVVAVMLEPVQGEGGVILPPPDYLNRVRALCDRQGWLMILDEIQTGMGRTGQLFAYQHNSVVPDIATLAKALGNGFPIGACLAKGAAAEVLGPGTHGSTFGGNPLACRVASAVLNTLTADNLTERATELGKHLLDGFHRSLRDLQAVTEIRGLGLMIGIELDRPCAELTEQALSQGLLINVTADRVIRLLPPLVFSNDQADQLINQLSSIIKNFLD